MIIDVTYVRIDRMNEYALLTGVEGNPTCVNEVDAFL